MKFRALAEDHLINAVGRKFTGLRDGRLSYRKLSDLKREIERELDARGGDTVANDRFLFSLMSHPKIGI